MQEALKDCCGDVWAIVEVTGPNGGYDCSHFRDTGGTRYKSPHESAPPANVHTGAWRKLLDLKDILLRKTGIGNSASDNTARSGKKKAEHTFPSSGSSSGFRSGHRSHLLDGSEDLDQTVYDEQEGMRNVVELKGMMGLGPSVTVRMLPSAIPDTRNFEYVLFYAVKILSCSIPHEHL